MILPFSYLEKIEKELGPEALAKAYKLFDEAEKSSTYEPPAELPSLEELIPMIQESIKYLDSIIESNKKSLKESSKNND